ncbi:hypothetical protein FHS96_001455 [Sphingomonas zeicaulis]|uniref:hypothetical protein n=1 Tax=Sphingomonas zeicaulis TaxID=1632740 RepID=UPI003D235B0C
MIVTIAATLLLLRSESAQPLVLLGGVLGLGTAIWVLLRMVLLRHAPIGWTIAAFALIGPTSLGVGLIHFAMEGLAMQRDVRAVAAIALAATPDGDPKADVKLPAPNGPMSRMTRKLYQALLANQRHYLDAVDQSGLNDLGSPAAVSPKGSTIDHCERLTELEAAFARHGESNARLVASIRNDPELTNIPPRLRPDFLSGLATGISQASPSVNEISKLEGELIRNWKSVCDVLARRRWSSKGGQFMFLNEADYNEFNRLTRSIDAAANTQQALQRQQQQGMRQEFQKMVSMKVF